MSQIEIADAAGDLHALIERARQGEEVVLSEGGRVLAKIVPVDGVRGGKPPRRLGLAKGKIWISDDFDAPLPDDVLALFYDGPLFPNEPDPDEPKP